MAGQHDLQIADVGTQISD